MNDEKNYWVENEIDTEKLVKQLLLSGATSQLRKKEEQLQAALLRVSVLRKKISIIKKQMKKL